MILKREKSGSWFSYNGEKVAQGREKMKDYLANNPEIMNEIDAKIREKVLVTAEPDEDGEVQNV